MQLPTYYVLDTEKGAAEGPHSLMELQELKQAGLLTPESRIAMPGDSQWERIADNPAMLEGLFPEYRPPEEDTSLLQQTDQLAAQNPLQVKEILAVNRSFEDPNALIPALQKEDALKFKGVSKKMRDYLVLVIGGNVLFSSSTLLVGVNPMTLASNIGFLVLSACGLAYIMFFVMDRY